MAKKKGGLGRGLNALFSSGIYNDSGTAINKSGSANIKTAANNDLLAVNNEATNDKDDNNSAKIDKTKSVMEIKNDGKPLEIKLEDIKANPHQPRMEFGEEALNELKNSIEQYGIIQPVVVRKTINGYELIAGERRFRAAKMAGLKSVPAIVKEYNDAQMTEIALIENIQRENLNPIEEAQAYEYLLSDYGLTQDMLSNKIGRSRSHIANFLRLLKLADSVRQNLADGKLTMGQAKPLLGLEDMELQSKAGEFIVENDLTARQVETLVKKLQKNPELLDGMKEDNESESHEISSEELYIIDAQEKLSMILGTGVRIKASGKKKKIEIDLDSNDELERVISLLSEKKQMETNQKIEALRRFSASKKFSV